MRECIKLLAILSVMGCSSENEPSYTCWTATDRARCPGQIAWNCTHGVVPGGCSKANMGYSEGYDWIVCCDEGKMP